MHVHERSEAHLLDLTDAERAEAETVADSIERIAREEGERVGALAHSHEGGDRRVPRGGLRASLLHSK